MSLDIGSLERPRLATANSRPSGQRGLWSAGQETTSAVNCRDQSGNGIMENETERTFLSCIKPKQNDIVSVSPPIGPVKWPEDNKWSDPNEHERTGRMLGMICKEFSMRRAAIPTHFLFNENGDSAGQRTPGYFNRSRLCSLIQRGYLKALTRGDVIYGVVPTQKGLEFVAGADHHS